MDATQEILGGNIPDDIIRVPDLWFPDHGLVLQAGNRMFRVSGGILAARSSVFRDMLSIPQPDTQPLIDGCPVVVLHDSPADAEYFLRAVFDSGFFERPPAPSTFNIVAGILRLSTKYDVEYLRKRALLHLLAALPRTVEEYDSLARPFAYHDHEFSVLILVHDLDLRWALPTALYLASCESVETIIDGTSIDGCEIHLPQSLQRTLLIGRSTLMVSQNFEIFGCIRSLPCAKCLGQSRCQDSCRRISGAGAGVSQVDPLGIMDPTMWSAFDALLCKPCVLEARAQLQIARQKIWDGLPAVFNLEPWDKLEPPPV
ncbi:hypothetical protein K438DRAFT_1965118 [Mycena galopus ATCC 62051]|nr:hypothetical protein K438DRAFT_1965118 [Mycena galopus ATCC 62051]